MTWVRHGYDTGTAPQIIVKIPNHRIRARERERERGNEGRNDANPHGGDVGTEATVEGQGVSCGGFGNCSACVPACT